MPDFNFETTITIPVDFEVFCGRCGAGLCNQSKGGNTQRRGMPFVEVQPCTNCMENEYDVGYKAGYDEGFADGKESAV